MAIKDEKGISRTLSKKKEKKKDNPEVKSYNENDFGHLAQEAAEKIIDDVEGLEVKPSSKKEDQYDKIDFFVKIRGFEEPEKVQFTIKQDPRERNANLSSEQKQRVEELEEKKKDLGDELLFVRVPASHFKNSAKELKGEKEISPEELANNMSDRDKAEVLKALYKSLERKSRSKAKDLREVLKAYN